MAQPMTPRKTCVLSDSCIVCGFSFVQHERTADGKEIIHKFYQSKLKLNSERIECIKKVTERSDVQECDGGICRKCFRSVESVIKTDEKNQVAKQKIRESMDFVYRTQIISIPSPRRTSVTKRMLRPDPPDTSGTCSGPANPLAKVSFVSPVKLSPFRELTKYRKIAPHPETLSKVSEKEQDFGCGALSKWEKINDYQRGCPPTDLQSYSKRWKCRKYYS